MPKNKFETLIDLVLKYNPDINEIRNSSHEPLDLLILLILNQSTSDILADKAFAQLKKDYSSYQKILQENNVPKLQKSIQACGLSGTKAKYILNALLYLEQKNWLEEKLSFINELSDEQALKELTHIKGIGIKSASCLLMFSFKRNTFPIDTHLFRIFKRVGNIIPTKAIPKAAHRILQPYFKPKQAFIVHVALIELGRTVCLSAPRKPLCKKCYLNTICESSLVQ